MQAWSGMFGLAAERGLVSPDYTVLRPRGDVNAHYLLYQFKLPGMIYEFHRASKGIGTGFLRLYGEEFGSIKSVLPPRDEQDAIVNFLKNRFSEIRTISEIMAGIVGAATSVAAREGTLLHEYRVSLMHEAVTGKLRCAGGQDAPLQAERLRLPASKLPQQSP